MKHTPDVTRRTLLTLLAALCLCAPATAQTSKETSKEFKPTRAQTAEAARLRGALADALGDNFEVVSERLTRRSNWHGGGLYWLAHLRASRPGGFHVKYKYRYRDHVHPEDPLYTFVERDTTISVGPRGCTRIPRGNHVCVGDTVILPVVFNDYTEHSFTLAAEPYTPESERPDTSLRDAEDAALRREPVNNPAAEFLKYVGSRAYYSPHRAPGYTLTFYATFEAVRPGSFNLSLGVSAPAAGLQAVDGSVPVVIVERGAPITILSSRENVHGYTERFSSNGGDNYLTTPLILQPGDRITLRYHGYSHRGFSEGGENEEALEASVKDRPPVVTMLPFDLDPAQDFNEWLVGFLPPRAIMRPTKRGR
ncbi:MAG TPA: hypothetical protein VGP08_01955 [Pyrinomonadaceae bacterium]|jgi:hypothetical protein|nr:hypothetical protein [Pyrinomonadaceae bacterium]